MFLIMPPSITKFAPVTLPRRSEASITISAATSSGVVKRPVAIAADAAIPARARVGVDAGGLRDRLGHAVLAEPELGADRAGRDAVDADAARPELLRERLAEVDDGGLRRAVVDRPGVRLEERVDRGDVDDRAAALLEHVDDRRPRRPQGGEEVQVHRPRELLVAGAEEAVQSDAGPRRRC